MPSYYRGIDDASLIWRINNRPSKRQRTVFGIDCAESDFFNDRKAVSFSSSTEDEHMMTMEGDSYKNNGNIETILRHYIGTNNDVLFLEEGLDKILEMISSRNRNEASKEFNRSEMLRLGGHWMITNLLSNLTRERERNCNTDMHVTDDEEERIVVVVSQSCQILQELLLANSICAHGNGDNKSNDGINEAVRYQIYCAGGIDAVVSSLKRFPTSFKVQLAGCKCLLHLVSVKSLKHSNIKHIGRNIYQSTDQLKVILRLLGGGSLNPLQKSSCGNQFNLSNTQIWQLHFVIADIVRNVVRQLPEKSKCLSEVVSVLERCFFDDGSHNHELNDDSMAIDECNSHVRDYKNSVHSGRAGEYNRFSNGSRNGNRRVDGLHRHMYEHLMTILNEESDLANANEDFNCMRD